MQKMCCSMIDDHFVKKQHHIQEIATVVQSRKNVTHYFFFQTIIASFMHLMVLNFLTLNNCCEFNTFDGVTFFQFETIVAYSLHLMVLFYKVIINHTSKRQFVVLLCSVIVCLTRLKILTQFYFCELIGVVDFKKTEGFTSYHFYECV